MRSEEPEEVHFRSLHLPEAVIWCTPEFLIEPLPKGISLYGRKLQRANIGCLHHRLLIHLSIFVGTMPFQGLGKCMTQASTHCFDCRRRRTYGDC